MDRLECGCPGTRCARTILADEIPDIRASKEEIDAYFRKVGIRALRFIHIPATNPQPETSVAGSFNIPENHRRIPLEKGGQI